MNRWSNAGNRAERGSGLVEFSLVAFLLVMLLVGVVEMCRMVLVYNDVSQAARAGVRYAIVHGSDNPATPDDIKDVVKNFLSSAPVDTSNVLDPVITYGCLQPNCTAPSSSSTAIPGSTVQITVTYPYDPFVTYFPISGINLSSTSKGVITF